ncbi:type III pantothenate kinase [Erythrobacteraceae bacterium CFH 75059]|uniref:type III pantothenate kinase n=1 Tax=Qipengyuania thermophila TaxID=2509361 RepID=UPI0010209AE5|nr:type III pantothenate kinase [Qipengyuania thermophila]TCD05288.1 type III pantothenate kinase [Erythrobacteraceae bacterium CFH 75059]
MLLAVDVGNTNVVFALIAAEGGAAPRICARWRIATDPRRTADEYAVWLLQLLAIEGHARTEINACIIGTVVPRARHNLAQLASRYFGVTAEFAGEGETGWPMRIDLPDPASLGADRALNAVAAHAEHPGDLIVVDFGTATTFDHVAADGAYKGGIIAPGINLSLEALVANTAKLPRVPVSPPAGAQIVARTTEEQMRVGLFWGYVAMIEGLVTRMRNEIGRPCTVIATGGLAVLFQEHTRLFDVVDGDLTLKGLALMARRNRR